MIRVSGRGRASGLGVRGSGLMAHGSRVGDGRIRDLVEQVDRKIAPLAPLAPLSTHPRTHPTFHPGIVPSLLSRREVLIPLPPLGNVQFDPIHVGDSSDHIQ